MISNKSETEGIKSNNIDYPIIKLLQIYKSRIDLQKAFPEVMDGNIKGLLEWVLKSGLTIDSSKENLVPYKDYYMKLFNEVPNNLKYKVLDMIEAVQQFKIGQKRKADNALNLKRRNIFGTEINCKIASIDEDLPYLKKFNEDAKNGVKVLTRDDIFGTGPPSNQINYEFFNFVRGIAGEKILDIGCGTGIYCKKLGEVGFECTGVEKDEGSIKIAREINKISVIEQDVRYLQIEEKSFDTILMIEFLEHLENVNDIDIVLEKAKLIARKNIIISVPSVSSIPYLSKYNCIPYHILEKTHYNYFTKEILENLLKYHKFKEFRVEYYGAFFPFVTPKQYYHIRADALI
jgi:2-polyprenyl-3-methyl-5-hydroxy-6-metoxy-1,4-benzoquinol methylase